MRFPKANREVDGSGTHCLSGIAVLVGLRATTGYHDITAGGLSSPSPRTRRRAMVDRGRRHLNPS